MIRRLVLAFTSAVLVVALVVPATSAAAPNRTTQPFADVLDRPAGSICDFELLETFTGTDVITEFKNRVEIHDTSTITHTNVDTGYTLTESVVTNLTEYPDDSLKVVGIIFHLRDASGKIVAVQAGQIIYNDGKITHATPGINVTREFFCPLLGGNAIPRT